MQLAQQQEPKWKKMLQHERDQKVRIEKMVEQLARQHSHLEEAAQHALPSAVPTGGHRASRNNIFYINVISNAVISFDARILTIVVYAIEKTKLKYSFTVHIFSSLYFCIYIVRNIILYIAIFLFVILIEILLEVYVI